MRSFWKLIFAWDELSLEIDRLILVSYCINFFQCQLRGLRISSVRISDCSVHRSRTVGHYGIQILSHNTIIIQNAKDNFTFFSFTELISYNFLVLRKVKILMQVNIFWNTTRNELKQNDQKGNTSLPDILIYYS